MRLTRDNGQPIAGIKQVRVIATPNQRPPDHLHNLWRQRRGCPVWPVYLGSGKRMANQPSARFQRAGYLRRDRSAIVAARLA